ncbi:hypothetical protein DFA_08042 [Cavenderia fasciculata]|uniref:Transmembrane protein n=1 Tax=Cavenderia fasciculata TaxID=261658 RepID=F4Q4Q2_CACFS|nr:uncharacterized protein DFA_08042 [Cavenderia fasciculata]EGG17061.1 hypothetical protein DFA_08042 [Cavenderia fasciculata]|eukprot:XP_004355545.1 hypothetical protein DFA_08042 [Cavenderia fasciculata]
MSRSGVNPRRTQRVVLQKHNKCNDLINVGIHSIQSFIPNYGILPKQSNDWIETHYKQSLIKIRQVYTAIQASDYSIMDTQEIRLIATSAVNNTRLCKILATKEVVLMLLEIIDNAENMWKHSNRHQLPLSDTTIHLFYLTLDSETIMLDCISLLNSILPYTKPDSIPFKEFVHLLVRQSISPSSYKLTCAALNAMIKNRSLMKPFLEAGIIGAVRFFTSREFKSEYALLRDYTIQISKITKKDILLFKMTVFDQACLAKYYQYRYLLLIPQEIRVTPHGLICEMLTDCIGYYGGWVKPLGLFVDYFYSDSNFYESLYKPMQSTASRYFFCSAFASSILLYFMFLVPLKGKIHYISSAAMSSLLCYYQDKLVTRQKLGGSLYKSFKEFFQTSSFDNQDSFEKIQNDSNLRQINHKSEI